MERADYWDNVYQAKRPDAVSWYQRSPERSLAWARKLVVPSQRIIDIGGGASGFVDALLGAEYERPCVLDVSASGLSHARARLGARAALVDWIVADITKCPVLAPVALWHDRAVLHFLTEPTEQQAYANLAADTILPGGHIVLATFAPDGPERCSGLDVQRHDGASIAQLLGSKFELLEEEREFHVTPNGGEQRFAWIVARRR